MSEPKRQVKFECSEQFYKQLMDEKLQRKLTLQQLAIRALERYFAVPESVHREVDEISRDFGFRIDKALREGLAGLRRQLGDRPKKVQSSPDPEEVEREDLTFAIGALLGHFPLEKLQLTKQLLALDLKHYQSARVKSPKARKAGQKRIA